MLQWPCQNDTCAHPKCFVLFLQGQLGVSALPLSQRKGPGRGPASLLGHPLGPCPGSSGLVKKPGIRCLDTEDQVLQVKWWPPRPLKLSGALGRGWAWFSICTATLPLPCSAPSCRVTGGKVFFNSLPGLFGSQVGSLTLNSLQVAYFISVFSYRNSWLFHKSIYTFRRQNRNQDVPEWIHPESKFRVGVDFRE